MASGATMFLGLALVLLHFHRQEDVAGHIVAKAGRLELVDRMRVALASASAAEKSAVLAVTDADSERFAAEARTEGAAVDDARRRLEGSVGEGGSERELLDQFSRAFADFLHVDDQLLALAVKNTNLKAYALAYGPAADALTDMTGGLTRLAARNGDRAHDPEVAMLALRAEVAALRVQTMLPPHIAEESDEKMDRMEAAMAKVEADAQRDLDDLAARPELRGDAELETATSSWARFRAFKAQILTLSRENTNVRSLTMSLDRKRKVMLVCEEALSTLRGAVDAEPIRGVTYGPPAQPR